MPASTIASAAAPRWKPREAPRDREPEARRPTCTPAELTRPFAEEQIAAALKEIDKKLASM